MAVKHIVVAILFIVIIGAVVYIYFKYEKPKQDVVVEYVNLSIYALENGEKVRTGYSIYTNGFIFKNGTTSEKGAVFEQVRMNESVLVATNNLENQTYYASYEEFSSFSKEPKRVELKIKRPGNITIFQNGKFLTDRNLAIVVSPDDELRNPKICFRWSVDVIYVRLSNYSEDKEPIEGYDKCYDIESLKYGEKTLNVYYQYFGNLQPNDYIKIFVFEKDNDYLFIKQPFVLRGEYLIK